jgi:mono/diheme cytochrome c family protein
MRSTMWHAFLFGLLVCLCACVPVCLCACFYLVRPGMAVLPLRQPEPDKADGGQPSRAVVAPYQEFIKNYCADCHSGKKPSSDLNLAAILDQPVAQNATQWEHAVRKLRSHQMPPAGEPHASPEMLDSVVNQTYEVEFLLDRACVARFKVVPPKNRNRYVFDDDQPAHCLCCRSVAGNQLSRRTFIPWLHAPL